MVSHVFGAAPVSEALQQAGFRMTPSGTAAAAFTGVTVEPTGGHDQGPRG